MLGPHKEYTFDVAKDSAIDKSNLEEEAMKCPSQFAAYGIMSVNLEERELILKQELDRLRGEEPTPDVINRIQKMSVERNRIRKNVKLLLVGKRAMELKNIAVTTLLARQKGDKQCVEVENVKSAGKSKERKSSHLISISTDNPQS
jgi:hypothetical protein